MSRSRISGGIVVLIALLWTGAATAQGEEADNTGFYVAPMVSYSFFGEDTFKPDGQVGAQLSFGNRLSDYLALELFASYYPDVGLNRVPDPDSNLNVTAYGVSALIFPIPDLFPVYALVGGGIGQYDFDVLPASAPQLNTQESTFVDVGIGFLWPITDGGIALRAEYRYRSSEVDAGGGANYQFRNNIISIGVQIPLTSDAKPVRVTPTPTPVPTPTPSDADGDGVINSWDRCPDTAPNAPATSSGCAVETDGGETDHAPIVLQGVTFAFDSAALTAQAKDRLDTVVQALKAAEELNVLIAGHTDAIGSASYNLALSQRRAKSVAEYLINHGIDPDRLVTKGFGETMPIAPNSTEAGRAKNRRVEFHIRNL